MAITEKVARLSAAAPALRTAALRVGHTLLLLTERRLLLFAGLDLLLLIAGVMIGLNSASGSARDMWLPFFIMPAMIVGVPMLADSVAVERRSGTLDLALTSPGARFYFERRVLSVCALIVAQGCIAMTLTRLLMDRFPLSGPFAQAVSVALFTGAATLNWSVRLRTAGAVMFATYLTVLVFSPWLFSIPVHTPDSMNGPMTAVDLWQWTQNNLVLLSCAAVFYAYARQRLMRPELVIT
jgi:ABC-type Na+ efflux pump permease subunit